MEKFKRGLVFFLSASAVLSLFPLRPLAAQEKIIPSTYYPLTIGTTWHYRVGRETVQVRVVKHENIGGVICARVEASKQGSKKVEFVSSQKEGIFRYQAGAKKLEPPLCLLKLPVNKGGTWEVDSKVNGTNISGTFALSEESVTVPAGKYDAVKASSKDFAIGRRRMSVAYWFAPNVGIVKQQIQIAGLTLTMELEKLDRPR